MILVFPGAETSAVARYSKPSNPSKNNNVSMALIHLMFFALYNEGHICFMKEIWFLHCSCGFIFLIAFKASLILSFSKILGTISRKIWRDLIADKYTLQVLV